MNRLDSFLLRAKRLVFSDRDVPTTATLFNDADDALLHKII